MAHVLFSFRFVSDLISCGATAGRPGGRFDLFSFFNFFFELLKFLIASFLV
jgi:hypothetical protein